MSLVSRCPRCRTLYRVTPAQLQARAGQVRCGRCMNVFDGFGALAVEQASAVLDPVQFEAEAGPQPGVLAHPEPASHNGPAQPSSTSTPTSTRALRSSGGNASDPAPAAATKAATAHPETSKSAAPVGSPKAASARVREFAEGPLITQFRENLLRKPSPGTSRIAACALLGLLLGCQIAYAFRSQLAARYPAVRSVMSSVCGVAGCTVSLPQRPDLVKIEASDVHMIDANRTALIQLTATLRSYASYDLAYPALDLVLTNANEHALARRIFVPEEYLDQTRNPEAGIPPRAEITVALDLDTGDLNAAGFRLDLIAAPAP